MLLEISIVWNDLLCRRYSHSRDLPCNYRLGNKYNRINTLLPQKLEKQEQEARSRKPEWQSIHPEHLTKCRPMEYRLLTSDSWLLASRVRDAKVEKDC